MGAISLRGCGFVLARARERFPCVSWPPTCCSMAWGTVGAGVVPGDVLRRSFGSFVAWVRFYPFVPFHAAKGSRFSFLGVVPFSSTWRGTFSLRFVAAHVLHGAGNSYGRVRARGRAGSGGHRCMGAVSLHGCGSVLARGGECFPRES